MSAENNHNIIIAKLVVGKKHTPLEISQIIRKAIQEAGIDPYKVNVMSEENYLADLGNQEESGVTVPFNDFFEMMTQHQIEDAPK